MRRYEDLSGGSGVTAYHLRDDAIDVVFNDEFVYRYDYASPGRAYVETMKSLARSGRGLASYVSQHARVREHYAAKWTLTEYLRLHPDAR